MSSAIIAIVVIGAIAAISSSIVAARKARILEAMHAVPAATIAEATADQAVRLSGTVVADGEDRVTGAFTGTPGVISISERWEKSSNGKLLRRLDHTVRACRSSSKMIRAGSASSPTTRSTPSSTSHRPRSRRAVRTACSAPA